MIVSVWRVPEELSKGKWKLLGPFAGTCLSWACSRPGVSGRAPCRTISREKGQDWMCMNMPASDLGVRGCESRCDYSKISFYDHEIYHTERVIQCICCATLTAEQDGKYCMRLTKSLLLFQVQWWPDLHVYRRSVRVDQPVHHRQAVRTRLRAIVQR